MTETPDAKAERLAATYSVALGGPVGLAPCGCPNRIDGGPPVLHICRVCGFESGPAVHEACAGCDYLADRKRDRLIPTSAP